MGPFINDCGKHIYAWIDGEWIDVTDVLDACVHLAEEEDEIPDDEIPFCEMDCDDCCHYDGLDDDDDIDDIDAGDMPFWGIPDVRRIVFSDPATIVFWDDGTKTVVKTCEGDKFERYMGFAAACMKKMFGSTSRAKAIMNECDQDLTKWDEIATAPVKQKPKPKEKSNKPKSVSVDDLVNAFVSAIKQIAEEKKDEDEKDGTPET